jgi:hypothetical protein
VQGVFELCSGANLHRFLISYSRAAILGVIVLDALKNTNTASDKAKQKIQI